MGMKPNSRGCNGLVDKYVGTAYDNVKLVADNIDDVTYVADSLPEVIPNLEDISKVSDNINDVVTVSNDIDNVNTLASDMGKVNIVADNIEDIGTVVSNITDINILEDNMTDINTVSTNIDSVLTVEQNLPDILFANDNITDIQKSKEDMADINTFVVSEQNAFTDNTGKSRKTMEGLNSDVNTLLDRTTGVGRDNVWGIIQDGIDNTVDGDYFSVVSANDNNYLDLYKNESGVAVFKKSYPSTGSFAETLNPLNNSSVPTSKAVAEYTAENIGFGEGTNLTEDELGENVLSYDVISGSSGFKRFPTNVESVTKHTEPVIAEFPNTAKYVYNNTLKVGTVIDYIQNLTDTTKLVDGKLNVRIAVKSPVNTTIDVGLYVYTTSGSTGVPIVAFEPRELKAGVTTVVSLSGIVQPGTLAVLRSLSFLGRATAQSAVDLAGQTLYVSPPFFSSGSSKTSSFSTKSILNRLKSANKEDVLAALPVVAQRFPYVELFGDAGLAKSPTKSIGANDTGWTNETRATVTYPVNTLFSGYDNMIKIEGTGVNPKGTRGHYVISAVDAFKGDLLKSKKINVIFDMITGINCSVSVAFYVISGAGSRWLTGYQEPIVFTANEKQEVRRTATLTQDEVDSLESLHLFFRQENSDFGDLSNSSFYIDSPNIFSGEELTYLVQHEENEENVLRPSYSEVDCWGDSITADNRYVLALQSELGVSANNFGVSSTWSQMIRQRFVDYYNANPEKLEENFILIFSGTNNLLNFNSSKGDDHLFNNMYARAYQDQMLADIKIMVDMIPHNNYIIVGGHAGCTTTKEDSNWLAMDKFDKALQRAYPTNSLNIRERLRFDSDYLGVNVTEDFVKPSVGEQVTVSVNKTDWVNNSTTGNTGQVCIGTKEIYDVYTVDSVTADAITCTLSNDGGYFPIGRTMKASYHLVADLNRGDVYIPLRVYSLEDVQSFENENIPRSETRDNIHFSNTTYPRVGVIFANQIKMIA